MAKPRAQTSVTKKPVANPPPVLPLEEEANGEARPAAKKKSDLWKALEVLASLRLTVVLFVLALILIFIGTLAQVDSGIWTVVNRYFRSFVAWLPFQALI